MNISLAFWILYLVAAFLSAFFTWPAGDNRNFRPLGDRFVIFVLIGLLGWKTFGPPIHG